MTTNTRFLLKVTKSSMYALVNDYFPSEIPKMKLCYFKGYRRSYWLEWTDSNYNINKAFLSACGGGVSLSIDTKITDNQGDFIENERFFKAISLDELIERNLVEIKS